MAISEMLPFTVEYGDQCLALIRHILTTDTVLYYYAKRWVEMCLGVKIQQHILSMQVFNGISAKINFCILRLYHHPQYFTLCLVKYGHFDLDAILVWMPFCDTSDSKITNFWWQKLYLLTPHRKIHSLRRCFKCWNSSPLCFSCKQKSRAAILNLMSICKTNW